MNYFEVRRLAYGLTRMQDLVDFGYNLFGALVVVHPRGKLYNKLLLLSALSRL